MLMLDFLMSGSQKNGRDMENAFITLEENINERIQHGNIYAFKNKILQLCLKFEDRIVYLQQQYSNDSFEYKQLEQMQVILSRIVLSIDNAKDEDSLLYDSIPAKFSEIKIIIKALSSKVDFRSSFTETLDKIVSRLEIITQNSVK